MINKTFGRISKSFIIFLSLYCLLEMQSIFSQTNGAGDKQGTQYYCDPVNGSMSNDGSKGSPWGSLADVFNGNKSFQAGDEILLMSGHHGKVKVTTSNKDHVVIKPAEGHKPTLSSIEFEDVAYWTIKNLEISPETSGSYKNVGYIVNLKESSHMIVDSCTIYSIKDNTPWSADNWVKLSCKGVYINGDYNIVRGCKIKNIDFGIFVNDKANENLIEHNLIANFSGDGLRGIGDYNTFQYNTIQDNYNVDSNHDDGFQSYSLGSSGTAGKGTVYGVVFRGNKIINITDSSRNFIGPLQGIGNFDGMFEDWVIENNLVLCNSNHGITLLGATNCKVTNNTVIDLEDSNNGIAGIQIASHKDGTLSSGNIITNNLSSFISADLIYNTVKNNITVNSNKLSTYFEDPYNLNFNILSGCLAIDGGGGDYAPEMDINKNNRLETGAVDIGAYEYTGEFVLPFEISLTPDEVTIPVETSTELESIVLPDDVTSRKVNYHSDNPTVAIVDENGQITALSEGTAIITAATAVGDVSKTCKVNVSNPEGAYNLAFLRQVSVSGETEYTGPGINLVDGNIENSSSWGTSGFPNYAEIDLGYNCDLSKIEVFPYYERDYQYFIEAKTEGGEYVTVIDRSNNTEGSNLVDTFSVTARFVKITVTGANSYSGNRCTLNEIKVYGSPSVLDTAINISNRNPASLLHITGANFRLSLPGNQLKRVSQISIFNIYGQLIEKFRYKLSLSEFNNHIYINETLPTGYYILQISDMRNSVSGKLIVCSNNL